MAKYMKHDKTTITTPEHASITRQPDREVDEEYVRNYIEGIDFFESIGGTETVRRQQGRVSVVSVSPDRTATREVLFVPIAEVPSL